MDSRRRYDRAGYDANITFTYKGKASSGVLTNISVGGCFLITSWVNLFSPGELVRMKIPYTTGNKHVIQKGRVIWQNDKGIGVEFL